MEYTELYENFSDTIKKHSSDILNEQRDAAFLDFARLGFPTSKLENYRYSDLRDAYKTDFGLNINRLPLSTNPYAEFKCDVPNIGAHLCFVVNDTFFCRGEKSFTQNNGVIISSLAEAAEKYPDLVRKYYGKQVKTTEDGNIAFNVAFAQDGFFMYIPKDVQMQSPVQLVNIMTGNADMMANSHNLIIIEEGAKVQLVVCDHTMTAQRFLANRITEVFVGKNAVYEHYKLENTHNRNVNICNLLIEQQASSNVLANVITLHNGLTRNNISIALRGEGAETTLCGMVVGDKDQHIDNFTHIDHAVPNCKSTEMFKYILDDHSRGAFCGKIMVAPNAQKTSAYQSNKNLCLSPEAKMYAKPQLEIYADDVKCSHGATVGQLDETALFYLRSRGISAAEARLLLMYAFTADVVENIRIGSLKDRIKMLVERRLRGEISRCEGCVICK
ncbi:Fe-S cluster assembly protein SufD [Bacteroidia bacterium]|nr:Fe-S cluster assembly protein SufD [Bacteroidia bacterium]